MTEYALAPCPAPRMTKSDKWKIPRRPCVARYFAFRDRVRKLKIDVPVGSHITFYMGMPPSWSRKKARELEGTPHEQVPDLDNLLKALLDSVYGDDSHIWKLGSIQKIWRDKPGIEVRS